MLLGLQDAEVRSDDALDYQFLNVIGGDLILPPDVLQSQTKQVTICERCNRKRVLICQIYAPLDSSKNHRILAVFCCLTCPKESSFSCWRIEFPDQSAKSNQVKEDTFEVSDWGEDIDDWGSSSSEKVATNFENLNLTVGRSSTPVSIGSDNLSHCSENTETPVEVATAEVEEDTECDVIADVPDELLEIAKSSTLPQVLMQSAKPTVEGRDDVVFKAYYVSVIDEEDVRDVDLETYKKKAQKQEFEEGEGTSDKLSGKKSGSGESYEKVRPAHGDLMTHKFLEVVRRCPRQILRYSQERGKGALLLADVQFQEIICSCCGKKAMFEFQLMPYLAQCLQSVDRSTGLPLDGVRLEFGTLLVFTCEQSCWTANEPFRREVIFYQSEPL